MRKPYHASIDPKGLTKTTKTLIRITGLWADI
jgi:hypothetical protein